jgi:hypothetical protein
MWAQTRQQCGVGWSGVEWNSRGQCNHSNHIRHAWGGIPTLIRGGVAQLVPKSPASIGLLLASYMCTMQDLSRNCSSLAFIVPYLVVLRMYNCCLLF